MLLRPNQKVYILDLGDNGIKLYSTLEEVFPYRRNHWSNELEYRERLKAIYYEMFVQLFLIMSFSTDEQSYMLSLLHCPNYERPVFNTIYQFENNVNAQIASNEVRNLGYFLYDEVRRLVHKNDYNKVFTSEYIVEASAQTYIILSVYNNQ